MVLPAQPALFIEEGIKGKTRKEWGTKLVIYNFSSRKFLNSHPSLIAIVTNYYDGARIKERSLVPPSCIPPNAPFVLKY